MGKQPKSILKVKGYSIYPFLLSKQDEQQKRGLMIRCSRREKTGEKIVKGKTKYLYDYASCDIELYDSEGRRMKATSAEFQNSKIIKGYDSDTINSMNHRIESIKVRIAEYVLVHPHINKELLLQYLYGSDFLSTHKKKKTRYITIPVTNDAGEIVKSYQFKTKEVNEILDNVTAHYEDEDDYHHVIMAESNRKENELERLKKLEERKTLEPLELYTRGNYDKENIFETAGKILFLNRSENSKVKKPFTTNWKKTVMKLFEYRSRQQPTEHIKTIDNQWIIDFINYFKENGYSTKTTRKFNPFNYDPTVFTTGKIAFYNDLSLEKFIKNVKEVFNYLSKKDGINVDIKEIRNEDEFNIRKVTQHTKKEFYLYKDEFDKLFYFNFKDATIKKGGKTYRFTAQELGKARDLFVLQTWLGGLRPNELYSNITLLADNKGQKVHYFLSKDGKVDNENPVCSYSELVLKRYKSFNEVLIGYDTYCIMLKCIAKQVFDRTIIRIEERDGKKIKVENNISEIFTTYFARKTFQMLLKEEKGISDYDIKAFTGHVSSDVQGHYTTYTLKRKREVMESIKPVRK